MAKFFKTSEWDDYWDSSKEKPKGLKKLTNRFREYFGDQYIKTLKKICSNHIGKILEVGCGTAYCSQKLTKITTTCYAIDYSEKAKKFWVNDSVNFVIGDGFSLPYKSNVFDIVWNAGVLEHFTNPKDMLKEMTRVCKHGGIVCVFVPYIFDFTAHLRLYGEENIFTTNKLRHLLSELQNVKTKVLYSCGAMIICGWGQKG